MAHRARRRSLVVVSNGTRARELTLAAALPRSLARSLALVRTRAREQGPTDFVAAFVKGKRDRFAVRAGDPQRPGSALQTLHDGARPKGYEVMKKQGGIVLGLGGDNSPWGGGIWYEGVMTQGHATDATEAQVFGNIVAAGYGK